MMVPTDYFIHMYNNLETPYFENIISIAIKKKIKINEPTDDVIYEILDDLITKYDEISYSKLNYTFQIKCMFILKHVPL